MSIAVIICNPVSDYEESIYIPVATELFFEKNWLMGCNELDLEWIPAFHSGIEIEKQNLNDVLNELQEILIWAKKRLDYDNYAMMNKRIELLIEKLPFLFIRNDIRIYIG